MSYISARLADYTTKPFTPAPPAPEAPDLPDAQKMALLMLRRRMGNDLAAKVLSHCEEMSFPEPEPSDWAILIRTGFICRQKMPKGLRTWLVLTPRGLTAQTTIAADLARKFKIHHLQSRRERGVGTWGSCTCGSFFASSKDRDFGVGVVGRAFAQHLADEERDPGGVARQAREAAIFERVAEMGAQAWRKFKETQQ